MAPPMAQPLYDAAQVETPEQIELTLPLAGIGSRAVAYLLDLLCQIIPIALVTILAFTLIPAAAESDIIGKNAAGVPELETLPLAILSLSIFAVNFGYFALFETFWRGQSPGKRWVRPWWEPSATSLPSRWEGPSMRPAMSMPLARPCFIS